MYGLRFRGALDSTTQAELEGLVATLQEFLLREHNEDGTHRTTESDSGRVPIGAGQAWFTPTPPDGWLLCDGRAVARTTYARLFKVIGTRYGVGNGTSTFNLPNGQGRFLVGSGGSVNLGDTGGSFDHTHGITSDGDHTHTIAAGGGHTHNSPLDSTSISGETEEVQSGTGATVSDDSHSHSFDAEIDAVADHDHGGTTGETGDHDHGGETDGANPPYLCINWIIFAGV